MRRSLFTALTATIFLASTASAQDTDTPASVSAGTRAAGDSGGISAGIFDDSDASGEVTVEGPVLGATPAAAGPQGNTATARRPSPSAAATPDSGPTQEAYDELVERLDMMEGDIERILGEQDKLKARSLADRLNWSGSYRFNFNFFHLKEHNEDTRVTYLEMRVDQSGAPIYDDDGVPLMVPVETTEVYERDRWLAPSWTHRLKLAMTYDFGESLRFYSQLGVYKYFNETLNTIGSIDHGSNAYPRDNSFRLERVYFDWYVTDWLSVSVGRIASPDGPPTELKENAERRSGWGVQMVNATIDTVMTTVYLGKKNYLRAFYSPFGMHGDYAVRSDTSLMDDQGVDLLHSWGAIFETELPGMKESIFQLGFLHVPKFSPRDVRIVFPGSSTAIAPSDPEGDDLGMYMGANTLLLLKNILNSGLDVFAAYGLTILKPTKDRMVYDVPAIYPIYHPIAGDTGMTADVGYQYKTGLASYEEGAGTTNFGHTVYTGLRYTIPLSERYPTRIGGEFNWGTKYHLAWSHPNDQLVNKLGNKGWAGEGYIIQQLVPEHLFARVGYIELQRDYQGLFVGPTTTVNQRIRNIYLLVDLSW